MTKENKLIIQIDDLVREMTDEEQKNALAQQKQSSKIIEELTTQIASRKSAYAKLAKLGLTEEEIASL
jgi:predicted ArsR family transcriptional regulator